MKLNEYEVGKIYPQPDNNYDRDMEKENGEIIYAETGTDAYGTEGIYLSSPGYSKTFYRKE